MADRGNGKLPLTLYTYGPSLAEGYQLQRKIAKAGSYKNWRLNGEFIFTPEETPERFKILKPGDIAVMGFEGASIPTALHIDYLASDLPEDKALKIAADSLIGSRRGSMAQVTLAELAAMVGAINPAESHPIRRLLIEDDVIEVVQGDAQAQLRVFCRTGRTMSQEELKAARQKAEQTGNAGEELAADFLDSLVESGTISSYEWVSRQNAVAPYDFKIKSLSNGEILLDVKSTTGDFASPLHISMAEIVTMAEAIERYDLYRIYSLTDHGGKLRVAEDLRGFAKSLLSVMNSLPLGVRVDGISVDPTQLPFGDEVMISLPIGEDD